MGQVKGKFINLTGYLMTEEEVTRANTYLAKAVNSDSPDLEDEGWYDCEIFNRFMDICSEDSLMGDRLYHFLGTRVYPTIKMSAGLPPELVSPLDFIKFEAEGYLLNHTGDDIKPRKILHANDGDVLMEASTPGYKPDFMRGVFAGILTMCDIKTGKVDYVGDDKFHITW